MDHKLVLDYFEDLDTSTVEQLFALENLYKEWNEKINLISRKDIEAVLQHHILHSLSISKFFNFKPGTTILDLGTGGGLPGIPLSLVFPEVDFTLIDGKGKKIMVVQDIIQRLSIKNASAFHRRAEEHKNKYDFVVSRAVTSVDKLYEWSYNLIKSKQINAIPNGMICLKGGNIKEELKLLPRGSYYDIFALSDIFDLPYYKEKYVIYIQL